MTHIKFTARHAGDERWVEAGANAFATHMWALAHCDEQESDGEISRAMAERLALPVPPAQAADAIDTLLRLGFWEDIGDGRCQILDYDTHALPAAELKQTRDRWATDRRRRRKHNNGVHDECDPDRCHAARMSQADTQADTDTDTPADTHPDAGRSPGVVRPSIPDQTRPDPTRPSEKGGRRLGGDGARPASARSAGAPHPAAARAPRDEEPPDFTVRVIDPEDT